MAVTSVQSLGLESRHGVPISVEAFSRGQIHTESASIEEDGTSLSSSSPELFDRPEHLLKGSTSNWQRFGSLESGTSTSITSLCSSNQADDSHGDDLVTLTPSKKRTLNGTIKSVSLGRRSQNSPSTISNAKTNSIEPTAKRNAHLIEPKSAYEPAAASASHFRARSSIPSSMSASTYANQCVEAAMSSRLDPYSLHEGEYALLVDAITTSEVTIYLNIRNAILRLWLRNPICSVTLEEAAGCAKESQYFGLAEFAYKWLTRNGYINFGCVEVPNDSKVAAKIKKMSKQRTVVVVGAGVSGLTTARQLENQFAYNQDYWLQAGEKPPKVIVIEGRKRIGGRVYSKPLRSQNTKHLPGEYRNTAEMGAMIVTGFDRGNPLDVVIRAQLGLPYHLLKDALTIYDTNGKPVDEQRDMRNTELYTDISDRTGEFRITPPIRETLRGDEDLVSRGRDPAQTELANFQLEASSFNDDDPLKQRKPISKRGRRTHAVPGTEKLTGRSQIAEGGNTSIRAARAAHQMGWQVKDGISKNHTVSLRAIAESYHHPSLGTVMDAAIRQYQGLLQFDSRDMRLLNWHHANLEYANAAPVTRLSLSGHDQDIGNEFEGAHSEVVGGYTQMPRGLMNLPTKLDVRFDHTVESIHYNDQSEEDTTTKIVCTNGKVIEADEIVLTAPLGVLKSDMIDFDPPLPEWKQGAIERMGFGLLNKVVLVYDEPFWDESRDMFGLLNEAEEQDSLDPRHYEARRGRFYLIWNASKISGRPMLIALMAGHAAQQAELTDTGTLLGEITDRLRKVFGRDVPRPREVIVTRWKHDPYSRGTYSYVAQKTQPHDYNLMAEAVGNLHFAGEATCGTHPATVHGAFLSGLRAASDVMDAMMGSIELPVPLVGIQSTIKAESYAVTKARTVVESQAPPLQQPPPPSPVVQPVSTVEIPAPIKAETETVSIASIPWVMTTGPPSKSVCSSDSSFWVSASFEDTSAFYETTIMSIIFAQIGERPQKPGRSGVNPFLLYTKAKWEECKAQSIEQGNTNAGRNAIRQLLGQWWKALDDTARQPYLDQSRIAQDAADTERKTWVSAVSHWDMEATRIRREYERDNPRQVAAGGNGGGAFGNTDEGPSGRRKTNVSTSIALDFTLPP